jgi:hypothetical protein
MHSNHKQSVPITNRPTDAREESISITNNQPVHVNDNMPDKKAVKPSALDPQKVQVYLDCALGEDPFQSVAQRCQTANCLANKLAIHCVYREYNVYMSFFLHRFVRFVEMQMREHKRDKAQQGRLPMVHTGYSIVMEYPNDVGQQWQFTQDQPMADRASMPPATLYLYHVEIILPSLPPTAYGSALLIVQHGAGLIVPFDKSVVDACSVIPWHEIIPATERSVEIEWMVVDNPILSLLWLHAALHMGGDVITTMKQQSHTELNGMAMSE